MVLYTCFIFHRVIKQAMTPDVSVLGGVTLQVALPCIIDIRHGTGLETGLFPAICTDHPRLAGKSRIKVRGQVECALF